MAKNKIASLKVREIAGLKKLFYLCVRKVEVKPGPVQLNSVRHAVEFWHLPPHIFILNPVSVSDKKKKSSICLTLLPSQTICVGSGACLLGGLTISRGGIELWLQLLSVVIGVSIHCGACCVLPAGAPRREEAPAQQEPDRRTLSHTSLSQKHPGFLSYVLLWQFNCSWLKACWNRGLPCSSLHIN